MRYKNTGTDWTDWASVPITGATGSFSLPAAAISCATCQFIVELRTNARIAPTPGSIVSAVSSCAVDVEATAQTGYSPTLFAAAPPPKGNATTQGAREHNQHNQHNTATEQPWTINCSPNPATSSVTLSYDISERSTTTVKIVDALQRVISVPLRQHSQESGQYAMVISTQHLAPALYTVRVTSISASGSVLRATKQLAIVR